MNIVGGSVGQKEVWQAEQATETKSAAKTETEKSKREEVVW